MVPPISGPPGLSIATVHGPPTIYERGQGLGFGYRWLAGLVSRVCMAGLDSRVCMAGLVSRVCPGGTKYGAVDSPGGPQFWGGTIDSVIEVRPEYDALLYVHALGPRCVFISLNLFLAVY